jgi:deazaflavin-dependent oxidoreductase (nitroreductase family)
MVRLREVGFSLRSPNLAHRWLHAAAASRSGAALLARILNPIDRLTFRLSAGRLLAYSTLSGLPMVMLTTTGRRTGVPRSTPLVGIPCGDDIAIIGSNFGQTPTPGWVHNLRANPTATVTYRGTTVPVVARIAPHQEAEDVFVTAGRHYRGSSNYRARVERHQRVHSRVHDLTSVPSLFQFTQQRQKGCPAGSA